MNVIFVHGFGGARGPVERALADAARGGPHRLLFVRWPSGDLREMRARAVVEVARKVVEKRSIRRGLVEVALQSGKQASAAWGQAVANVPAGAAALADAMKTSRTTQDRVSILAFSLGCRVVLHAIASGAIATTNIDRLVFAASAAPASSFEMLTDLLSSETRVTHVFSTRDTVLDKLYPLGAGKVRPSGRRPLEIAGVDNIEVQVGHRGYATIADQLWRLAIGEASDGATPRISSS